MRAKEAWNRISYEVIIFAVLIFHFLSGRALDLDAWSSAWDVMDYSMGFGTRLFIGSIYRIFYGRGGNEYLDITVAYKYVGIGIMLTITVLTIVLGRLIRMAIRNAPKCKDAIIGTAAAYLVAPFSIAYVWNEQNLGRLDVYMLLTALLAILAGLLIKNVYVKFFVFTLLGVMGLAIHQGFAFLYYPLVFTVMCYDVFQENRIHWNYFGVAAVSTMIEVVTAVYFQFFSKIHFDTLEETMEYLTSRTNLVISEFAIQLEYFGSMKYQLDTVTSVFFHGNEAPWRHLLIILLMLSPILVLYVLIWKDIFSYLKMKKIKLYQSAYFYAMLSNLCFVPMFLIHVDWGRHLAPLLAAPAFVFLFYLAKKDKAMRYAYKRMENRIKAHPWYFILAIVWIATLDSFGARIFQKQAGQLFDTFQYGFHI